MDNIFDLKDKTALITGASSGLGKHFAMTMAQAGVKIIAVARTKSRLQQLVQDITKVGGRCLYMVIDMADSKSIYQVIRDLELSGESIDILINNAGIAKLTPIFDCEQEDRFTEIMKINVIGLWTLTREVAQHMKKHNIRGSIINIGSIDGANKPTEGASAYCSSKAAVIQITRSLVSELSRNKIRINCILPGLFHTPLTEDQINTIGSQQIENLIPLNFIGKPEDLDGVVFLLASNKASRYITGACITVDGGISWV